jgi:membrane-bound inhibitor of C-type lysozyme
MIRLVALALLLAAPAAAETQVATTRYTCDRDVMIPETYVTAEDQALVVIYVEGSQITLFQEPAASGVRYGWPSDGSNYVWWTSGDAATLYWKEPGSEAPILTCLEAQ